MIIFFSASGRPRGCPRSLVHTHGGTRRWFTVFFGKNVVGTNTRDVRRTVFVLFVFFFPLVVTTFRRTARRRSGEWSCSARNRLALSTRRPVVTRNIKLRFPDKHLYRIFFYFFINLDHKLWSLYPELSLGNPIFYWWCQGNEIDISGEILWYKF